LKPEIKFGFLSGILLICWTLIQYFLGFHTTNLALGHYSGYFVYLILFLSLFLGLREKQIDYNGHFSLRKGIRSGLFQLIITSTPSSFFLFIYSYKINPFWVEKLITWQRENTTNLAVLKITANDQNASAIILSNTEVYLCVYFLSIILVGGLFSFLISSYLINKSK
jgi:hypothetical protein